MIRDRIVFGTNSQKIRERLISEGSELTLDKASNITRNYELAKDQLKSMTRDDERIHVIGRQRRTPPNEGRYPKRNSRLKERELRRGYTQTEKPVSCEGENVSQMQIESLRQNVQVYPCRLYCRRREWIFQRRRPPYKSIYEVFVNMNLVGIEKCHSLKISTGDKRLSQISISGQPSVLGTVVNTLT